MAKGYSNDLRARLVGLVETGESRREAARLLDIGASTAIRWIALDEDGMRRGEARHRPLPLAA
jgi:transposase